MDKEKVWGIIKFAKQIKRAKPGEKPLHYNTVDRWFSELEACGFHYIQRVGDSEKNEKKIYDELDLAIAERIDQLRSEDWTLPMIYKQISEEFDCRHYPEHFEIEKLPEENMMHPLSPQESVYFRMLEYQEALQSELADISNQLENMKHSQLSELREQRINDIITEKRVLSKLKIEALEQWANLPKSERMRKAGLFREEEDTTKRDLFVENHINKNFPKLYKEQFGVESELLLKEGK